VEFYTHHHQKYLCVDDRWVLLGGCDINWERNGGWCVPNGNKFLWHECAVLMPCAPSFAAHVRRNAHQITSPPPVPFTMWWHEHGVIAELIAAARTSLHIEQQTWVSTRTTENKVCELLARRIVRAFLEDDVEFRVLLITNKAQKDEPLLISALSTCGVLASYLYLVQLCRTNGVTIDFMRRVLHVCGLATRGGVHIKVHSNFYIQDGQRMLRSSGNLCDRSLSRYPCDAELGVCVQGACVARLQQVLLQRYVCVPMCPVSVAAACAAADAGTGLLSPMFSSVHRTGGRLVLRAAAALGGGMEVGVSAGGVQPTAWTVAPVTARTGDGGSAAEGERAASLARRRQVGVRDAWATCVATERVTNVTQQLMLYVILPLFALIYMQHTSSRHAR
jgi:hypothetical protein